MNTHKSPAFYAFYSFKGGVGRSMALLNSAWCLASNDRRVLMVDLDLDSPGLSFLPPEVTESGNVLPKLGAIDVLESFASAPEQFAESATALLSEAIHPFQLPRGVEDAELANVSLLPAGDLTDSYVARISSLQWHNSVLASHLNQFATSFRAAIGSLNQFDYVLIDCRTGWSEVAYVACRYLADHIIAFCGLNDQNAKGTAHFLGKVASWNVEKPELSQQVALVASPVPEWEEEAKRKRIEDVCAIFKGESGETPKFTLQLPYHPSVAICEQFVVSKWPDCSLGSRYFELAQCILGMNRDSAPIHEDAVTQAIDPIMRKSEIDPDLDANSVFESLRRLRGLAPKRFSRMGKFCHIAFSRQGKFLLDGFDSRAGDFYGAALRVAVLLSDSQLKADALFGQGESFKRLGNYTAALDCYLEVKRNSELPELSELCAYAIADIARLRYNLDAAASEFSRFLTGTDQNGNHLLLAAASIGLGDIQRLKRGFDKAKGLFQQGLQFATAAKETRLLDLARIYIQYLDARTNQNALLSFREMVTGPSAEELDVSLRIRADLLLAELERLSSQTQRSGEAAARALELAEKHSLNGYRAEAAACLAETIRRSQPERAKEYAASCLQFFATQGVDHPLTPQLQRIAFAE